jgi:hypothetical protein
MILACEKLSTGCPQVVNRLSTAPLGLRQCETLQVQILEVPCAPIIQWESYMCQVYFQRGRAQVQKLSLDRFCRILYNLYIDRKETEMTDNEFFRLDQEQWYQDFVDAEVYEINQSTILHEENFLLDVPF